MGTGNSRCGQCSVSLPGFCLCGCVNKSKFIKLCSFVHLFFMYILPKYFFFLNETGWGWKDALRVWDGNAIKFGCDECCKTINIIKCIE